MSNLINPAPRNWVWKREDGTLFSSAAGAVVPETDAHVVDFFALGLKPTPWPRDDDGNQTDAALDAVLHPYGVAGPGGLPVPDGPTLADWRVGLLLWQRLDDVTAKVATLVASTKPTEATLGKIAQQQLEYSNTVSRDRLLAIHDAFGFSTEEVDESLWRADRVAKGDLSGMWPLPKAA